MTLWSDPEPDPEPENLTGSGSEKKVRIRPDPQHCFPITCLLRVGLSSFPALAPASQDGQLEIFVLKSRFRIQIQGLKKDQKC